MRAVGKKKIIIFACIGLGALLIVVGYFWILSDSVRVASSSAFPTKPAPPFNEQQAAQLSDRLTSGTEDDLRTAVALPEEQTLESAALRQIASLGKITFDTSTFKDNNDGTATVIAGFSDPSSGNKEIWTVQLINIEGEWKISSTEPVYDQSH